MPITAMAIGAGVGLLKGATVDAAKEKSDRKLAAETIKYSPWTGMQAQPIKAADPMGSAMQGGVAGGQFGAGLQSSQDMHNWMQKGYSPYGLSNGPGPAAMNAGQGPTMANAPASPYQLGFGRGY